MGTTASLLLISHEHYLIGQVEIRACICCATAALAADEGSSYVQEQVDAGFLTPNRRATIRTATSSRDAWARRGSAADVYKGEIKVGDVFLVASDGLTGMVDDRRLQQLLLARSGRAASWTR